MPLKDPAIRPRPYQEKAEFAVYSGCVQHGSALCVMPTGTGKTITMGLVARRQPEKRVLWITDRVGMIKQIESSIRLTEPGTSVAWEANRHTSHNGLWKARHVIGTSQTVGQERRLKLFDPKEFGTIIFDECHHDPMAQRKRIHEHFRDTHRVGCSATPIREDGAGMGTIYESAPFVWHAASAIHERWLVPVLTRPITVEGIELDKAKLRKGDYDPNWLSDVLCQEGPMHRIARTACDLIENRSTIVYCVDKKHVEAQARIFDRYRKGDVRWATDDTPHDERDRMLKDFRAGKFRVLVNCGLYLEGTDLPICSCVVLARPTRSKSLLTQIIGRGLRPEPGLLDDRACWEDREIREEWIKYSGKPDCLVLDFVNASDNRLVAAVDVLAGNDLPREVRDAVLAGAGADDADPIDLMDAIDEATMTLNLLREEEERRRNITVTCDWRAGCVDVFGWTDHNDAAGQALPQRDPPTQNQMELLRRLGKTDLWIAKYARTRKQASKMIDYVMKQQRRY